MLHTTSHSHLSSLASVAPSARAMSDAIVGTVNSVADATGLPVAAVILIAVVVVFGVLVQICRAPRSASTDANDAPELEAIGENERRVDSIRVRAGRYVATPPTADEVELLEQPRKPKKPGKKKKAAAPR